MRGHSPFGTVPGLMSPGGPGLRPPYADRPSPGRPPGATGQAGTAAVSWDMGTTVVSWETEMVLVPARGHGDSADALLRTCSGELLIPTRLLKRPLCKVKESEEK